MEFNAASHSGNFLYYLICIFVLLCWVVGVRRRFEQLQMRCRDDWRILEKNLKSHTDLVRIFISSPVTSFTSDEGPSDGLASLPELQPLVSMVQALDNAMQIAQPSDFANDFSFAGMAALSQKWICIEPIFMQLCDYCTSLKMASLPSVFLNQCEEAKVQINTDIQKFKSAVEQYNQALEQFPAILIAGFLGFKPAARLSGT